MKSAREMFAERERTAVMLLRRSTERQDQSVPQQRKEVEAYAARHGYKIVAELVDDAISGDEHSRRGAFAQVMSELESPSRRWNFILTGDRSRHTRADVFEAATYADRVLKAGADVVYCAENKRLSEEHQVVWAVETHQKHAVLEQISHDTLRGMLGIVQKGYWAGGPVPYGYDAEIIDKLTQKPARRIRLIRRMKTLEDGTRDPAVHHLLDTDGKFVREVRSSIESALPLKSEAEWTRLVLGDPQRIEAVRFIFQATADRSCGLKKIARELNRREIPSPGGRGPWQMTAVKAILDNPVYHGLYEWNSRTEAKYHFLQDGRMVPKPRSAKSQVFIHEERDRIRLVIPEWQIVSKELWDRAHANRERRADNGFRPRERMNTRAVLGGLVYCGMCGRRMYGHVTKNAKATQEHYACSTYLSSGKEECPYNHVPRAKLEDLVVRLVRKSLPMPNLKDLRQVLRSKLEGLHGVSKSSKDLGKLREKFAILDTLNAAARTKIGMEDEYQRLKADLAEASPTERPTIDVDAAIDEIVDWIKDLSRFEQLSTDDRKAMLARIVDRIVLRFDRKKVGSRERSVFVKGTVEMFPVPTGQGFRPERNGAPGGREPQFPRIYSGGGI